MITVARGITIAEQELEWSFFHASGPGGQHVNKCASAVRVQLDIAACSTLSEEVRQRIVHQLAGRLNNGSVLAVTSQRFRSQARNREEAVNRLVELIREGAKRPRPRRPTSPTRASRLRRIESKRRQSERKAQRKRPIGSTD